MSAIHTIELVTRDGHSLTFACGEGQTLLEGAAENGITLASMCRQGSCGVCRARCNDGAYRLGDHSPSALTEEAAALGEVLLCCTYPRGPLSLAIEQDRAAIDAGPAAERGGKVAVLEPAGGGVMRLVLELEADADGDGSATFEAGQYFQLTPADSDITRAYSAANTPNWEGLLEFYIRLQPEGRFSNWLRGAAVGDALQVQGPSGAFTLNESSLAPRYFVAGGSGLAPVLSMLRWMGEMQAPQPARLYFGVNKEADLFARDELEELKAVLPGLAVELCLWRPEAEGSGFTGTPVDALARDLPLLQADGPGCDIYVCGPPALVEATEALALSRGIDAARVHSERFLPA